MCIMNSTNGIQQVVSDLKASPLFSLSLSSKELFHSNFLAWLGNNDSTKQFFVEVINELVKDLNLQSTGNWIVEREDHHFDLCINEINKKGKKGKYLLIIENKVKSIPIKKQLDEYETETVNGKGSHTKYLLLTLTEKFAHRTKIENNPWIVKTYQDLANIMRNKQGSISDPYLQSLLKDYIEFIENLDALVRDWQNETDFAPKWEDIPKLKDLHAKIQFSRYCEKLKTEILSKLNDIVVYDDDDIPADADIDSSKVYVKVYWGYASRGQDGILDVEIPVTCFDNPKIVMGLDNNKGIPRVPFNIKIQVQGHSYRHVLETNTMFDNNTVGDVLIKIGKSSLYTDSSQFNYFSIEPKQNPSMPNYINDNIFYNDDNKHRRLYPVNKGDKQNQIPGSRWPFASYKDKGILQFIYQYRIIKDNISIDQVLDNIVKEVERILNYFT